MFLQTARGLILAHTRESCNLLFFLIRDDMSKTVKSRNQFWITGNQKACSTTTLKFLIVLNAELTPVLKLASPLPYVQFRSDAANMSPLDICANRIVPKR